MIDKSQNEGRYSTFFIYLLVGVKLYTMCMKPRITGKDIIKFLPYSHLIS